MNIIRRLLEDLGIIRNPSLLVKNEATVQALLELSERENLPPEALVDELLWNAIEQRDQDQAEEQLWNRLSYREKQVVALAMLGYTNPQAAYMLSLSISTVKSYISTSFYKLDVHNRSELLAVFQDWDFESWARANIRGL